MKTQIKLPILILFLLAILVASCRSEVTEIIDDTQEPSLKANSTVAKLMKRISLNDGSNDNIIDNANCFNLQLPVTVIVNGLEIVVNSAEDFEVIEAIFDEFDDDDDSIQIEYPIRILLSDFTEVIINNQGEQNGFMNSCNGENEVDDDIECLDFQYPINVSIFNTTTEQIDRITIANDRQMHEFIEDLDEDDIANIDFPISIILLDGTEIIINSLEELEIDIDNAKDDCDEDDDYDYNDDDNNNLSEQEFTNLLTSCSWKVDELEINDQDLENFKNYALTFNPDGTVAAELDSNSSGGTWSVSSDNNGLRLTLTMDSLTEFNNNWRLHKIEEEDDDKDKVDLRTGRDKLELIKNCN